MSGAGAHPSHYLPAVQAPFVTPNANEPHLTMMVPPQPLSAHRRGQVLHHVQHRPSNNYHHQVSNAPIITDNSVIAFKISFWVFRNN